MSTAVLQVENRPGSLRNADWFWHISRSPLFSNVAENLIQTISDACTDRLYSSGAEIFRDGDSVRWVYFLNRGCIKLSLTDSQGRSKTLGFFKEGIFGDEGLQSGETPQYGYAAVAHQESWMTLMERDYFLYLVHNNREIGINYMSLLASRILAREEAIRAQTFQRTEERVAGVLRELARRHARPMAPGHARRLMPFPLSHREIADLCGANRPHISTILSRFRRTKIVDYRQRRLIIDMGQLEEQYPV